MKRLALATLVAAAIAGTAAPSPAPAASRSTIAYAASVLAGERVTVSCVRNLRWGGKSALGLVGYTEWSDGSVEIEDHIDLHAMICRILAGGPDQLYQGIPYTGTGEAVLTVAHESAHVRGILNERKAECWGLRNVKRTAILLGFYSRDLGLIVRQAREATTCR